MSSSEAADEAVRATNCEACGGKVSAVRKGYWSEDALLKLASAARLRPVKKPPEINRGYYGRVAAVRRIVRRFLDVAGPRCRIINLGCGFDTLHWTLREEGRTVEQFVELDFPAVTLRKANAIRKEASLVEPISPVLTEDGDLHSERYHLLGCDLRNLSQIRSKLARLNIGTSNVDDRTADLPTLFLAECVLVYIEPEPCAALLSWISAHFSQAVFVNYEQVNLNDNFGRVMLDNLNERGCPLVGAQFCASLETQNQRFLSCGWKKAISRDMNAVWNSLPTADRRRVESIEMLDEGVLLTQLLHHYCIAVGIQGDKFDEIHPDR